MLQQRIIRCMSTSLRSGASKRENYFKNKSGISGIEWGDQIIQEPTERKHQFLKDTLAEWPLVVRQTMTSIQKGFNEIKVDNPDVQIEINEDEISLNLDRQPPIHFRVTIKPPQSLEFFSAVSGQQLYMYCMDKQKWIHEKDNHDFEGLLTRDLMRFVYGVPHFSMTEKSC